jgi:hypothetical protein
MFTIERSWFVLGRGELAGRSEAAARRLSGPVGQQLLLYLQFGYPTDEGVIDDALPLVREALALAAAHPDNARSRVYAHYMAGANHWAAGRIPAASEHLAEARRAWDEIAPRDGDRLARATAISLPMNLAGVSAIAAALAGDDALRDELVAELDKLAAALESPASAVSAGLFAAMASTVHGDAATARRWSLRATAASTQVRLGHISPAAAVIEAWTRPATESEAALTDAIAAIDEIDAGPTRVAETMLRTLVAEVRWRAGDAGGARKDLERARADADERGERFWLPEVLRLDAEIVAAEGAPPSEVAALLDEAIAIADAQGEPPLASRARAARERLVR